MKIKKIIALLVVLIAGVSVALGISKWEHKSETDHARPVVEDETQDWLLYVNKKSGFAFKHPQLLTVKENSDGYVLIKEASESRERNSLTISPLWEREENVPLDSFVHNAKDYSALNKISYTHESTSIVNGAKIFRFQVLLGSDSEDHSFYLRDDRHGVDSSYPGSAPAADTYKAVLSTFRFLP